MRLLFTVVALFLCFSSIFIAWPQIDIEVSSWFFHDAHFYSNHTWWIAPFYFGLNKIIAVVIVLLIASLFVPAVKRHLPIDMNYRRVGFYLVVLIVGSGLIVNLLFKEHWGRARPHEVTAFHGSKVFTPAFIVSDACEKNCSFSSGHVAGAFSFIALAMLFGRHKLLAWGIALSFGALVGVARIAAGGHFLSDVITSFFVMLIVALISYRILFKSWYDLSPRH